MTRNNTGVQFSNRAAADTRARALGGAPARQVLAAALIVAGLAQPPAAAAATDSAPPAATVVLKAAHLFDAVSGKLAEPGVVVVTGNRISAVGPTASWPADARVVELGDATLMPGFIDAHVHLSFESGPDWYRDEFDYQMRFPAEQAHYAARYARLTLEAGVTTARDLGSWDYLALGLRNAINAGVVPGPHLLISNAAIGSSGGHADEDPFPPQRIAVHGPLQGICNGASECRAAVRYQIKYGADQIKFMASGGVFSLSDPVDNVQLTQDEMDAIVSESHAWGRKVAAHCHGDRAAKMAIKAGVDSIEHGTFLLEDTLREMKARHVYLVPTLSAPYWANLKIDSFPPAIAAKERAAVAAISGMFRHAVEIGVPIAMGTDAALGAHGQNGLEFRLMVEDGMAPAAALLAGTAEGARLLGVDDRTGTLVPGKWADVVAVPGNPLSNIRVTEHPLLVVKEGAIVFDARMASVH